MSRLFDDVAKHVKWSPTPVCVDITNVANYYAMLDKDEWDLEKDFPNIMPPFISSFFEWRAPTKASIGGVVYSNPENQDSRNGAYAFALAPEDVPLFASRMDRESNDAVKTFLNTAITLASKADCVEVIAAYSNTVLLFTIVLGIDKQGRLVKINEEHSHYTLANSNYFAQMESLLGVGNAAQAALSFLNPFFLATSFMHCKNVVRKENVPPPKVQARRAKDGKPPLTKYYTLEIEAMKRTLQTEGGASANGLKKAMHICRGHFATYDEKPLFGKVKGTFWVPQHVKGSKAVGEIVKDYSVKGPKVTP